MSVRIRSFRSEPAAFCALAPMRIDRTVTFANLLRGLHSVGLSFQHDEPTGTFVIMADPEVRP
jgi:hypothetical protein